VTGALGDLVGLSDVGLKVGVDDDGAIVVGIKVDGTMLGVCVVIAGVGIVVGTLVGTDDSGAAVGAIEGTTEGFALGVDVAGAAVTYSQVWPAVKQAAADS